MARQILTDEHWSKLKRILLAESIYDKSDLRLTVEGMLYRMPYKLPLARPARGLRRLERGLQTLPRLVSEREVVADCQRADHRP